MRYSLILAACLCTPCAAQDVNVEKLLPQAEPPIQGQLGKVAAVLNQSSPLHLNVAAIRELNSLYESVSDKGEIVDQVAIFATGPGEQQPLVALAIMDLLQLPPKIVIPVLAPHLDAENPKLRSFVRDWFQNHDNGGADESPLKPVNFADYADYVRRKLQGNENIPEGYVDYLFERSPGRSLLIFNLADRRGEVVDRLKAMRRELEQQGGVDLNDLPPPKEGLGRREILLAEHIISEAIWLHQHKFNERFQKALPEVMAELEKLAKHDRWWAKLYVVHIMRRHPMLLQDHILRQLAEDENALVRKAALVNQ